MNQPFFTRFAFYRKLARLVFGRASDGRSPTVANPHYWFHAASAGELEGLLPVIQEIQKDPEASGHISVFSRSAEASIQKLQNVWSANGLAARWSIGLSPREGGWWTALSHFKPVHFVSYRYEAWPELWGAASQLGIPITIVGARRRGSLIWAKRLLRLMGVPIPRLQFLTFDPSLEGHLKVTFKDARVLSVPNPRWARSSGRVLGPLSERGVEVAAEIENLPAPRIFLSQVWESDFGAIDFSAVASLAEGASFGSCVLIPHELDAVTLSGFAKRIESEGLSVRWSRPEFAVHETRSGAGFKREVFIVNELGILPELYRHANSVYVGGGFEKGIHSTIEPAILGVSIACGPKNIEKFEEVSLLRAAGQLKVVRDSREWQEWVTDALREFKNEEAQKNRRSHWEKTQLAPLRAMNWKDLLDSFSK